MAKDSSNGWSSALADGADTIVARASGPGRGALCVVRLSGPSCSEIASGLCRGLKFAAAWEAQLVGLADGEDGELEKAVAIPYHAPRSYTGEDMLEMVVHGSGYVVEEVIGRAVSLGARRAIPGEYTRRAVANGKLDLVRAEAIRDLIDAETALEASNARRQLSGLLSDDFRRLRDDLVGLLARLEAGLDFAAQDVVADETVVAGLWDSCRQRVARLLESARAGELAREGLRLVIVGAPNAGKSTMFNQLLGNERAIVDAHPGTTRDVIEAEFEMEGIRVALMDTAGIREAGDRVELEGIRRTRAAAAAAHAVIELWSMDDPTPPPEWSWGVPVVRVRSKGDLETSAGGGWPEGWLKVSAKTGEGMETLRNRLVEVVHREIEDHGGIAAVAGRHRRCLEVAASELEDAAVGEPELAAEAVRWALRSVRELTGEVLSEAVLDEVFATFCIGK